jgi:adhesin/invasin
MPAMKVVRTLRLFALVAAVISVSACPATEPKVDDRPFSIDVGPDSSTVQSGLTTQLTATVKNKAGADISGADVVFESEDSTVAKVSSDGVVTGARAGTATISASLGTLKATALVKVTSGQAVAMTKVGDAPTTPVVGASGNVSVRVTDAAGNVVPNASVDFAVTAGGGSITPASASTNASGIATATFTMGTSVGVNTATAKLSGSTSTITFSTTSISGPAAAIEKITTDPAGIVAGAKYGEVRAKVTDQFGNPRVGVTVVFSVVTGGGSVTPTNAVTASNGEATAQFTTGKTVGVNTAKATVSGVTTPVTFTTTTVAGPSTKVTVSVPIVTVGSGSSAAITASTADANNNPTSDPLSYESRNTNVATVASDGLITGTGIGQTFVVATGSLGTDSLLVVTRPANAPVLMPEVPQYAVTSNTDIVVTISMDMTATTEKLGAMTVKLEFDPSVLSYRSNAPITGVGATVNTTATASGSFSFAVSNAAGLTGRAQLIKVTLHASGTAGKTGTLRLVASEAMAAVSFSDLLPSTMAVLVPIIIR